jgi:hypothetical protein
VDGMTDTLTAEEAPGASAEPRADVRRLTTMVAGSVLPGLAGPDHDEALEILGRLEP